MMRWAPASLLAVLCLLPASCADPPNPLTLAPCSVGSANQTWTLSPGGALYLLPAAATTRDAGAGRAGQMRCLNGGRVDQEGIPFVDGCDPSTTVDSNHKWQLVGRQLRSNATGVETCLAASSLQFPDNPVLLRRCAEPAGLATHWVNGSAPGLLRPAAGNASFCLDFGSAPQQLTCASVGLAALPYCNASLPPSVRARDLVSRMSVFELKRNAVSSPAGVPRLGLPRFGMGEALHGVVTNCGQPHAGNTGCATSFPHALMMAASFNRSLWAAVGEAIGVEGRAFWNQGGAAQPNPLGALNFWTPDINLFRDPRWGRGQEVPGEDPFLTGEYVMQFSYHMQHGPDQKYLRVLSTAKHFLDYDQEGSPYGVMRGDFDAIVADQDQ